MRERGFTNADFLKIASKMDSTNGGTDEVSSDNAVPVSDGSENQSTD